MMANVLIKAGVDLDEKVLLMQRDAQFEITCEQDVRSEIHAIRREIRATRTLPKVPKVFLGNDCVFNCAYCECRCGNEGKMRYAVTPKELAQLSYQQAMTTRSGIFVTSAILRDADYTQEQIIETLRILREDMGYGGYLHAKVMPGADAELIRRAGGFADRLSVNIEVAHSDGYRRVAKNKNKVNILTPMAEISRSILAARAENRRGFATSQTTQLMAGAAGETDRTILTLADALYRKYRLSRVYYTAFHYLRHAKGYDIPLIDTPKWRMNRLYQADRLMQQYGFAPDELAPEDAPGLYADLEPKAAWALRHFDAFPVEINTAPYETLLRVPGIGVTFAKRIEAARRYGPVSHETLSALGISMKRCTHFITCGGKYRGADDPRMLRKLLAQPSPAEQTAFDFYGACGA